MYCGAKNLSSRISFRGSTLPDLSYQEMVLLDMWRMHEVPEIYISIALGSDSGFASPWLSGIGPRGIRLTRLLGVRRG